MNSATKFAICYWLIGIAVAIIIAICTTFYMHGMSIEQSTIVMRDFFSQGLIVVCCLGTIGLFFALLYSLNKDKQGTSIIKPK
jgi:uncharacterized YccA/Bax inhibitor family protein